MLFIIQRINDANITSLDDLQKAVKTASTSKDPVLHRFLAALRWRTGCSDHIVDRCGDQCCGRGWTIFRAWQVVGWTPQFRLLGL